MNPNDAPVLAEADAVLLDMDGTLVNSEKSVVESWNRLFREAGSSHTYVEAFHGVPGRELLRTTFPDATEEQRNALFESVERLEVATAHDVELIDGVAPFIADLERAQDELGRDCWTIVTSCSSQLFSARFSQFDLPIPATAVTADHITRGKPHPEPYLTGARRIGVDASRCIVVEDAIPGITAGKEAGAFVVGVTTTTSGELVAQHANLKVDSLADLTVRAHDGRLQLIRR